MLRTMGVAAAALLLTSCAAGESTYACGACDAPHSGAGLVFSEVPQADEVRADVCIAGGSCYHLRARPHSADNVARACWTDSFPRVPGDNRYACSARTASDGTWHVYVRLPGNVEGKTVSVRSTSATLPFSGQSVAVTSANEDADAPCSCPAYPLATINVG